ncbi:hypothetical protein ACEV9R_17580 [Vibrio parahaemolyticus]
MILNLLGYGYNRIKHHRNTQKKIDGLVNPLKELVAIEQLILEENPSNKRLQKALVKIDRQLTNVLTCDAQIQYLNELRCRVVNRLKNH